MLVCSCPALTGVDALSFCIQGNLLQDSNKCPMLARSQPSLTKKKAMEERLFSFSDLPEPRWAVYRVKGDILIAIDLKEDGDFLHSQDPDFLTNVIIFGDSVTGINILGYTEKDIPGVYSSVYSV